MSLLDCLAKFANSFLCMRESKMRDAVYLKKSRWFQSCCIMNDESEKNINERLGKKQNINTAQQEIK